MIDPQSQSTRQLTTGVAVIKNLAGSVALQRLELIAEARRPNALLRPR